MDTPTENPTTDEKCSELSGVEAAIAQDIAQYRKWSSIHSLGVVERGLLQYDSTGALRALTHRLSTARLPDMDYETFNGNYMGIDRSQYYTPMERQRERNRQFLMGNQWITFQPDESLSPQQVYFISGKRWASNPASCGVITGIGTEPIDPDLQVDDVF